MTWLEMYNSVVSGLISQVNAWWHAWFSGSAIRNYAFVPMVIVGLVLLSFAFNVIKKVLF